MGIDVGCALVVGLPFYDVVESGDEYYEKYDFTLSRVSPLYDCPSDECLLGVPVAREDYTYREIKGDILQLVEDAKEKFKQITGKDGKLYVSADVT